MLRRYVRGVVTRCYQMALICSRGSELSISFLRRWSRGRELNSRPADYESAALPTELPRPALGTIASAEIFCQFGCQNPVLSPRERVHGPADSHTDQQEEEERPHDVFHTLDGLPAAQEAKRNRNHQCKQQHRLQMSQAESDCGAHAFRPRAASYACSAASRFSTPAAARKRVP